MVIHLLQTFSNVIFRTFVQQLIRLTDSASRGISTVADLLIMSSFVVCLSVVLLNDKLCHQGVGLPKRFWYHLMAKGL